MSSETTRNELPLQLATSGLRFTDPPIEAAYRAWQIEEGIPLTRLGMLVSVLNFGASLVVLYLISARHRGWVAAWVVVVVIPAILTTWYVTYRPKRRRWIEPLTAFTTALAGVTCVSFSYWSVDRPEISMAATIVVSQFGFTIFPLRITTALAAVIPFVLLNDVLALLAHQVGDIDGSTVLLYSLGPSLAFISGLLANVSIERRSRERFRQERIIEHQRSTIERERARADVAERSRELSEALSRLTESGKPLQHLKPGDVLDDKFRVIRTLGRGGMGEVHEVEQLSDGRRLALKVLTGNLDREALMRFAREARIAAALDHPNVVDVVDVGVGSAGMYLVMELVDGPSLDAERERFGEVGWALPILRQVASALAAMHGRGVVHRDLKPANILLDGDIAKVTDFGIASLARDAVHEPATGDGDTQITPGDHALTRTGIMLGTPLYMAPELAAGSHAPQPTADVWSFGVIAYELLAGKHPFAQAPIFTRMVEQPVAKPPRLTTVEPAVSEILESCLEEEIDRRPTAAAISKVLGAP